MKSIGEDGDGYLNVLLLPLDSGKTKAKAKKNENPKLWKNIFRYLCELQFVIIITIWNAIDRRFKGPFLILLMRRLRMWEKSSKGPVFVFVFSFRWLPLRRVVIALFQRIAVRIVWNDLLLINEQLVRHTRIYMQTICDRPTDRSSSSSGLYEVKRLFYLLPRSALLCCALPPTDSFV